MKGSSNSNTYSEVPEVVIMRLPRYLRTLTRLHSEGINVASSRQLGELMQMTPAQIRKDLSYFGRFGKQGRGYTINGLIKELRTILALNDEWKVGLVGIGRLGRAILSYPGFSPEGFKIVAAFDYEPSQVGQMVGGIMIQPMQKLAEVISAEGIQICITAVPADAAQSVIDELIRSGVKAIVNYAPVGIQVPHDVKLRNIDPVIALQSMTYYIKKDQV